MKFNRNSFLTKEVVWFIFISSMAYRNKYDRDGKSFESGENAERVFFNSALKAGWAIEEANLKNQFSHIDFFIKINGNKNSKISVEVKSRKKIKRSDKKTNDDLIWIEFKNVQGNRGWLYGAADCVAFEREFDFLIVNRKSLARLCEKICDLTKLNADVTMPLYTGYQRKNRNDLLSLIRMSDIIENIKHSFLKK